MSNKWGAPSAFLTKYDTLVADAVTQGVCKKIVSTGGNSWRACSRPLVPGSAYCERHDWMYGGR